MTTIEKILVWQFKKERKEMKQNHNRLSRIVSAIAEKHTIQFSYKDCLRIVNPHAVYINKSNYMLDGFQTGGKSHSNLPEWKCYKLDDISQLEILNKVTFEIEAGFNVLSNRYIQKVVLVGENDALTFTV